MLNVLVVEDSMIKAGYVIELTKPYEDLKVTHIKSLNAAICEVMGDIKYDLIILDLGLPRFEDEMSYINPTAGLHMITEMNYRDRMPKVPIIINSSTKVDLSEFTNVEILDTWTDIARVSYSDSFNNIVKLLRERTDKND